MAHLLLRKFGLDWITHNPLHTSDLDGVWFRLRALFLLGIDMQGRSRCRNFSPLFDKRLPGVARCLQFTLRGEFFLFGCGCGSGSSSDS